MEVEKVNKVCKGEKVNKVDKVERYKVDKLYKVNAINFAVWIPEYFINSIYSTYFLFSASALITSSYIFWLSSVSASKLISN